MPLSHAKLWKAVDNLARREGLSPSGLARRAGLDATSFNPSKRFGPGDPPRPRWPVLATGHHDVSDHRFEQRGLLHAVVNVAHRTVHVVVVHLGLIHASRERQVQRLGQFIQREVPAQAPLVVAGDFNDWGARLLRPMEALGLKTFEGIRLPTFPARLPLLHLDRIYARGLRPVSAHVPHGKAWTRMSDHLPLIAELAL